jgi:hypothetical protein
MTVSSLAEADRARSSRLSEARRATGQALGGPVVRSYAVFVTAHERWQCGPMHSASPALDRTRRDAKFVKLLRARTLTMAEIGGMFGLSSGGRSRSLPRRTERHPASAGDHSRFVGPSA